jgi:transcriptional regulator with XRE-family HTH domain
MTIKKLRKSRDWLQSDCAARAGISSTHWSAVERAYPGVTIKMEVKIAKGLQMTRTELIATIQEK